MLSCKKCGAQMSGIDLVCKKCGTPWGKKGKSKKPVFFIIFFAIILIVGFVYYNNPAVLKDIKGAFELYLASNNKPVQNEPIPNKEEPSKEQNPKTPEEPPKQVVEEAPVSVPIFTKISSSSNLPSDSNFTYTADKLLDGNASTAWLEGGKGNGINEWILLTSDSAQDVSGIIIYNGYQKNATTYKNNGRLKKVRVAFSDGSYTDRDIPAQSYLDSLNGVTLDLGKVIKTTSIQVTVLDAYTGSYYNDTAINEIKIY